ncbi:pseudouridine synthase [Puniceicoccaceae bacterium K14]|nr:pseudouridine synthase [Puniceicoccaceae bacterium K14]
MYDGPIDKGESLEILFQDEHYIAINKPSGLLVHRSNIAAQEEIFALQMLRDMLNRLVYPVHRIDKPTSGILLFATTPDAMIQLKRKFESCEIGKTYLAIVRGFAPMEGIIEHPLRILNDFKGPNKKEDSQEAETHFKTLDRSELPQPTERYPTSRFSLVQLHPKTGRRHQLRRHMVHINSPIVGDTRHGDNKLNKRFRNTYGFIRLMLHASQIEFEHPFSKERIHIKSKLEGEMKAALEHLQLNNEPIHNNDRTRR